MARRTSKKSKPSKRTKTTSKKVKREPILAGISPQRRIDIFGIILLVIGLLTIVSLITSTSGSVTGWWVANLSIAMGWDVYLLPVVLILIGGWMLLRNMDKLPQLSAERIVGFILVFINLAAWFHLFIDGDFTKAAEGTGGGYLGAFFKITFVRTLGKPGAVIALIAWLLISLILMLDLSMANVLKVIGDFIAKLYQKLSTYIKQQVDKKRARSAEPIAPTPTQPTRQTPPVTAAHSIDNAPQQTNSEGEPTSPYINNATLPTQPVWVLPDINEILEPSAPAEDDSDNDRQRARVIEETLRSFGAPAHVVDIQRGPTITMFGVEPDFVENRNGRTRVRVSKITALADDLALALAAARIRIQAPVPKKGYIGIEVPNRQVALVSLKDIVQSSAYQNLKSPLKIALGKDVSGNPIAADLTAMPHLLIAGTTGAGKSVCINDILACFLLNMTPDQLRMILVDPKRVELTGYNGIPHLLSPVIVDAEHVVGALQWMMREMDNRYRKFSESNTRNIADYNAMCEANGEKKLPYLLIVIDELADLMMLAPMKQNAPSPAWPSWPAPPAST